MSGSINGVYRATALNTQDPAQQNRVNVLVPGVSGQTSGWAMPCMPPGSSAVPNVGDTVWVMFEGGDPSSPVWLGVMNTGN